MEGHFRLLFERLFHYCGVMSSSGSSVMTMHNVQKNFSQSTPMSLPQSASEIAADLLYHEYDTIKSIAAIMHHPRSLARPTPTWRPPIKQLPTLAGGPSGEYCMSITRHRVGARVKARVRGFGQDRIPAYLITIRITENFGQPVEPAVAEGWVRTLVPAEMAGAVHEVSRGPNATYVWLVDSSYQPVHSPESLFAGFSQAA